MGTTSIRKKDSQNGQANGIQNTPKTHGSPSPNGLREPSNPNCTTRTELLVAHAIEIKSLINHMNKISQVLANQTSLTVEMLPITQNFDLLGEIEEGLELYEARRKKALAEKREGILQKVEASKKNHNTKLKDVIRQYVAGEIANRVQMQINKFLQECHDLKETNGRLRNQNQAILDNIRVRTFNSTLHPKIINSKIIGEQSIKKITRPMSISIFAQLTSSQGPRLAPAIEGPSQIFPENIEALMRINIDDSARILNEYGLSVSKKDGEVGRLANLNQFLSYCGVRCYLVQTRRGLVIMRI